MIFKMMNINVIQITLKKKFKDPTMKFEDITNYVKNLKIFYIIFFNISKPAFILTNI